MTPHYADDWLSVYQGDARDVLPTLPADSVDCIVTSPPYWGLRDYGSDGQLGLEPTPEQYVANLVGVFRELRRVLKPSGTCWLNLGDSYVSNGWWPDAPSAQNASISRSQKRREGGGRGITKAHGLKGKDLVGIPWRVAFALQADGWWLRSDIIWSKPNPMPESVTDRPTKAHEYLFLLTRSAKYYYDADAVREPTITPPQMLDGQPRTSRVIYEGKGHAPERAARRDASFMGLPELGRNLRSVWTIATRPYPGAHFAVFPPELPERCIQAGSSERGVCPECGAPWERVVERGPVMGRTPNDGNGYVKSLENHSLSRAALIPNRRSQVTTTGWRPTCDHTDDFIPDGESSPPLWAAPVPAVILDPFAGSGTVGLVANRLSRRAILIDLNADYLKQQMKRNAQTPLGLAL